MQMPGTMQFSSGYSLIGVPVRPEMARRVDMRAAVVGHGEIHDAVAMHVAGVDEGLRMGLPHAVDDRTAGPDSSARGDRARGSDRRCA